MTQYSEAIQEGHYAKKQILCPDWLISWSHASRFQLALRIARELNPRSILDYGCGDGTFLAMAMNEMPECTLAIGTEIKDDLVQDCVSRLSHDYRLQFVRTEGLDESESRQTFDAIFCMEVLEHVPDVTPLLDRFDKLLAPGGALIISVPVETGLPVLVKQTFRRIAGWRGIGDYPGMAPYSYSDLLKSVFAGPRQHIVRPLHRDDEDNAFHCHKGFNWMALRKILGERFVIEELRASPLSMLSPHLASQCWFVLRKPPTTL
jgi:SAM-dependent methyltransferase